KFLSTFPRGESGNRTLLTHPLSLTIVAFVVTAIPAFLLTKVIGKHLEDLVIIGWSLLIGGIVMWIVDAMRAKAEAAGPGVSSSIRTWKMEEMSLGQAIWIGFCQIFSAVFPGTSRSMSTIAGGQIAGMSGFGFGVLLLPIDTNNDGGHAIHSLQIGTGQRREPHRRFADDFTPMGGAGDRIRSFVHRRVRFRCLVPRMGKKTRLRAICRVPHH